MRAAATTSSSARFANSTTAESISARSVMSRGKVTTWLRERGTQGSELTVSSPPPLASSNNHRPVRGPNVDVSSSASACANCHTVAISSPASFFVVFGPTPHSASTARSPITSIQFNSVRVYTPAGFANPVATLARCLLSLIPTEHDKPVAEEMTVRTCSASSPGSSTSAPRYASSQPQTSSGWPRSRSSAITCSEAASYAAGSDGRKVASGQRRAAQRHPRVDTEFAGFVRRAGDDLARFGRVAAASDNDWQPDQFGVTPQFDRRQKLVEVDVQDPARLH